MSKKLKLVYIEWEDAGIVHPGDWCQLEDLEKECAAELFMNRTVGWIVKETDKLLVLSSQIALHEDEDKFDLITRIPKSLIRKRKVLKLNL